MPWRRARTSVPEDWGAGVAWESIGRAGASPNPRRASGGSEELRRVELLDRDDPDPRQRRRERLDVELEVEALEPLDCSAVKPLLRNSRNAMTPDPPLVVEQPLELLEEVAVVADEHDVGVAVADGAQGALDRDVDDLDVGVTGRGTGWKPAP